MTIKGEIWIYKRHEKGEPLFFGSYEQARQYWEKEKGFGLIYQE